ncbi:MAG: hypothetical protein AAB579_00655 [Patescibacteria group bacterium]
MATGTTRQKFDIKGDENPNKQALVKAWNGAFDIKPVYAVFTVEERGQAREIVVQVTGLEYESGNPNQLNIKGIADIGNSGKTRIKSYYNADRRRGYIESLE